MAGNLRPEGPRGLAGRVINPCEDPDEEYTFGRQAFLSEMITHHFDEYEQLVEQWFWCVHDKFLNHHPTARDVILDTLQKTSDRTRSLYTKLTSDPRYKRAKVQEGGADQSPGGDSPKAATQE